MKVFSLSIFHIPSDGTSNELSSALDLSYFTPYQQESIADFMKSTSKSMVERSPANHRQSLQDNDYIIHAYYRNGIEQLTGTALISLGTIDTRAIVIANTNMTLGSCDHNRP